MEGNPAGGSNTLFSRLSQAGVNGAFAAANKLDSKIGSPHAIAALPAAQTYALFLAGQGIIATVVRQSGRQSAR